MKNQRRFAPTKTGRLAPEQVAAFLRNQWPESAEYADMSLHSVSPARGLNQPLAIFAPV